MKALSSKSGLVRMTWQKEMSSEMHNTGPAANGGASIAQQYVWPDNDLSGDPRLGLHRPGIYEREVERIFHGRTWNYVALEAEMPNAGDFIRSNVGPTPVVVARAEDGSINVSRTAARTAPRNSAASCAAPPRNSSAPIISGPTT